MAATTSLEAPALPNARAQAICLGLILAVALVLRIAGAWAWEARLPEGQRFGFPDSDSYWALGTALANGEPYQFGSPDARVFRTPGYPLLLATVMRAAGADVAPWYARMTGAVLGTATVAGIYVLARSLFDPVVGVLSAALVAIYPGAIALSVFVLSEALFVPLMALQLALWVVAWQSSRRTSSWTCAALAGLAAAGATLARPSWLLFVPFAMALGVLLAPLKMRHFEISGILLLGLLLGMFPWWIRNARVTGHFVPTTLQVGASLYDGLHPGATGASEMSFVPNFEQAERAAPSNDQDSFEYRLDRRLRTASLDWAKANPGRALQLIGIKFARMWNVWPNENDFRAWPLRMLVAATYLPAILLAIRGAWQFGRSWPAALCWLPAVYLTALHVIFVSSLRYREPAMLPLLVLAAAALSRWLPAGWNAASFGNVPHDIKE